VVHLELLDVCYFPLLSSVGEDQWLLKVLCIFETVGTGANFCSERRVNQGWQKHFSFGQAKYNGGIMHLCGGVEAADYLHKALKFLEMGVSDSAPASYPYFRKHHYHH